MSRRSPFRKSVLDNGLTIVSESQAGFQSLSLGVWVRTGTRNERTDEAGISHFLEHMLFKGTRGRSALQIAKEVDQVGGEFNAFTARENTCFHLVLLNRDLGLGLDILGDVILDSLFGREELERERKVILQEIAMIEESPEELAHDLHFELAFGKHGLGRNILGTESSVRRMRRADLLRYFHRHYRPDQLILSVSGDVTHEMVLRKLGSLRKKEWPGRPYRTRDAGAAGFGFEPAPAPRAGSWWVERPTEQVHLVWGTEGIRYDARDRFAAYLLNVYLGGGMSSELFQEIREKRGLAYTVYSNLSPFIDAGLFTVYAATAPGKVSLCVRLIEECVSKLTSGLLAREELTRVKENLKGTILLSSDSVEARMTSIAMNEMFLSTYVPVAEVCRRIDEVSAEDLRRVARRMYGSSSKRSLLCVGPKPSKATIAKLAPEFPRKYQRSA